MKNFNPRNDTPTETVSCYNKCTYKNLEHVRPERNSSFSNKMLLKHVERFTEEQSLKFKECLTDTEQIDSEGDTKKLLLQCFALADQ